MRKQRRAGKTVASLVLLAALVGLPHAAFAQVADRKNHYILDCNDDCLGTVAVETAIGSPRGIATDADGNVYFSSQNVVFKLRTDGSLVRFAGTGEPGYSGDGGSARTATLNIPLTYPELQGDVMNEFAAPFAGGIAVAVDGTVYIADGYNHRIRRVGRDGAMSTVADATGAAIEVPFAQGVALDDAGDLYFSSMLGTISRRTHAGVVDDLVVWQCDFSVDAQGVCIPGQIALDSLGAIHFPDVPCRVRVWDPIDGVTVEAGEWRWWLSPTFPCGSSGDGGPATSARLEKPFGIAMDADDQTYFSDAFAHCVRKVDRDGIIARVAGLCRTSNRVWLFPEPEVPFTGDGGPATTAELSGPMGVAVDLHGNLYISDTGHMRVRKVTPDGIITTVAGNGMPLQRNATGSATPLP